MNTLESARAFIYRNARPMELALWQFHFEGGSAENVLHALSFYQNDDGGFGHGLEADNWNPCSSPITTWAATEILCAVDAPREHPIVQGILRYLDSGEAFDADHQQWRNTVPSSNSAPRACWWTWEEGKEEFRYNPTAALAAFLLHYAEKDSALYAKGLVIARTAIDWFLAQEPFSEKHVTACFLRLAEFGQGHDLPRLEALRTALHAQVRCNISTDLSRYAVEYADRPSDLIDAPTHPYYADIADTAEAECQCIIDTQQADGGYPVPWQWWNEYTKEYEVAANWWRSHIVIKYMVYLRNFGRI